jgi:HEAT repeat protein
MTENTTIPNFAQVVGALQNTDQPFPERLLHRLSDLSTRDVKELTRVWPDITLNMKQSLLKSLIELAEEDTLVNFDEFGLAILNDPDPSVRVLAIRLLGECETVHLLPAMTDLMMSDQDETVRAAAAAHLGAFVLRGELENLPDTLRIANFQNLYDVVTGHDAPSVRRRALESLGYSSNPKVHKLVQDAFDSKDLLWQASALYAMGRSADERWAETVISMLESPDLEVQYEAVRAAGELELKEALEPLLQLLDDEEEGTELRQALIWSISQIGGEEAKAKLEALAENAQEDDEIEMVDKALENLELSTMGGNLDFMNIEPPPDSTAQKKTSPSVSKKQS